MISTCKECVLDDKQHSHARIQLTRCGTVAIDILEKQEHIETELDCVHIRSQAGVPCLICTENKVSQQSKPKKALPLRPQDAHELDKLIKEVSDEYETLMNDLM